MRAWFDNLYERAVGRGLFPFYEGLRGRRTFRYRAEFERNQWLSTEALKELQWGKLQALLRHAYATVPYYRALLDEAGLSPETIRDAADFSRLPMLDKAVLRERGEELLSAAFRKEQLTRSATGGSTGEPMQYYYNRDSYERRMAAAMRGDGWAGWRLGAPELYIWGAPLIPQHPIRRLKTKLHFAGLRRTDLGCFDLTPETIGPVVAHCNRVRPRVIVGYANSVYEFARYVEESGLEIHRPEGVIVTAERVFPHQKETIARALGTQVFERYGCREVMMVGAECEQHDGMHVTVDNVYVEIVRNGRPCEPGELGEILLTDLHNYAMPLIRYRVGDVGMWYGKDCPCGRGLPLIRSVEGRILDMITTPAGRVISGVFFPHLLKDFAAIRAFEVIQEARDLLTIRVALHRPLEPSERRFIEDTVARTVGPEMRVEWTVGPDVEIERRAKFRPVQSRVKVDWETPVGV